MKIVRKYVFCFKGPLGFLCDSDWDGDSFCSSPLTAYQYDNPSTEGRGAINYECVKICIITYFFDSHLPSKTIPVSCHYHGIKKTRYKCKCLQCGNSTKNMSTPELAQERYKDIISAKECTLQKWGYVKERK